MNTTNQRILRERPSREDYSKVMLFVISPILGLFSSLRNADSRSSYIVYFLFALTFGFAFTVTNIDSAGISVDGAFYRRSFEEISRMNDSQFLADLKSFFSFNTPKKDFGFEMLSFVISRFTNNYHFLFLCLALIFSYFQLRSLKFLTSNQNFRSCAFCLILLGLFSWNSIFNINGCRFWISAWIIVYCCFQVFVKGNYKYIFLTFITPIIHGSYWIALVIFLLACLFCFFYKLSVKILILLFVSSFFYTFVIVDLVQQSANYIPDFLNPLVDIYTSDENLDRLNVDGGIHDLFRMLIKLIINALTIILILERKRIVGSNSKLLFIVLLLIQSFANYTMSIPSLGSRFVQLTYPLIAYIWLDNITNKYYKRIVYVLPFVFILEVWDVVKLYLLVTDYSFYFLSPVYTIIKTIL